jgi:hypothetical protein
MNVKNDLFVASVGEITEWKTGFNIVLVCFSELPSHASEEEYLQSFMPDTLRVNGSKSHPTDQSARSTPDSSYHEHFRDISSPFKSEDDRTHSQLFEDDVIVVTETAMVESAPSFNFEASDLDKLPSDNITRGPPVSGGYVP